MNQLQHIHHNVSDNKMSKRKPIGSQIVKSGFLCSQLLLTATMHVVQWTSQLFVRLVHLLLGKIYFHIRLGKLSKLLREVFHKKKPRKYVFCPYFFRPPTPLKFKPKNNRFGKGIFQFLRADTCLG